MKEIGIPFSWFWAYCLAAILGLIAGELIEKIAKAVWVRIRKKEPKTVLARAERQVGLAKESPDKPKFNVTNYKLGKELKRQQIVNQ